MSKRTILTAARRCAERHGLYAMTRADIARAAGVSDALVSHHYGTMDALRGELIAAGVGGALAFRNVLAQALTCRDRRALVATAEVKRDALNTVA